MGNSIGKMEEFSDVDSDIPFVMIELSEEKEETIDMMYVFNQMELLLEDMERLVIGGESIMV